MELFQEILRITITDLLLLYSRWNINETGSAYSSCGTFVKQIIVGRIIGTTFITLVGAHWILLHKNKSGGNVCICKTCN